jgi:diketogulonate reductase-like aldo/keto reductase
MTNHEHITRRRMLQLSLAAGAFSLAPFSGFGSSAGLPSELITRPIPGAGERLPAIGMGTWLTFDVGNDSKAREVRKEVLRIFAERGGRVIDSSPMYGSSETVVGDLAAELGLLDHFFMATKVWTSGRQQGIRQMNASMRKMRSNPIDLMQVHNMVDFDTHIKTLREWKETGKIRYIGVTHYLVNRHDDLADLIKREPALDFVQVNFSIGTRHAQEYLLPLARENGVAIIINRPFEGGALFRRINGKKLPPWAADYDIEHWSQFFLKYIISHPAVTCAIPATTNPDHMRENIGAAYGRLPDEATRERMVEWWEE